MATKMARWTVLVLTVLVMMGATLSVNAQQAQPKKYAMKGEIKSLDAKAKSAMIDHRGFRLGVERFDFALHRVFLGLRLLGVHREGRPHHHKNGQHQNRPPGHLRCHKVTHLKKTNLRRCRQDRGCN